jgi:glycosyltransferase involved in cell wall biosynthesis
MNLQLTPEPIGKSAPFSIVIPTWNNLELLRLCVQSLQKNSVYPHQIIIHVNDGSDGSLEWVKSQGLEHTHSSENIGICLPVNCAAAKAKHDYILYLNDDMYCCPGWDSKLAERVEVIGHDAFMLSGTMIEPVDSGNPCVMVSDCGRDAQSFQEAKLLAELKGLNKTDWYGATWPPTLVHRRWWHAVGGYSTEFSPGMSSDNDFSMKMWAAGCRVFVGVGDSMVYHFMCKSTGRIVKNNGRKQFMRKWGITSSLFDRYYLRRGVPAETQVLPEPSATPGFAKALRWSRFKSWLA